MLDKVKFWAWLGASDLNLILDESELRAQSLKVEAPAFQALSSLSIYDPPPALIHISNFYNIFLKLFIIGISKFFLLFWVEIGQILLNML